MHAWFWWGDLSERGHLEDLGIDGRTKIKFETFGGTDVGWIDLAQNRDK